MTGTPRLQPGEFTGRVLSEAMWGAGGAAAWRPETGSFFPLRSGPQVCFPSRDQVTLGCTSPHEPGDPSNTRLLGRKGQGRPRFLDSWHPELDKVGRQQARPAVPTPHLPGTGAFRGSLVAPIPSLPDVGVPPQQQMSRVSGWQCQEPGLAHCSQHP